MSLADVLGTAFQGPATCVQALRWEPPAGVTLVSKETSKDGQSKRGGRGGQRGNWGWSVPYRWH